VENRRNGQFGPQGGPFFESGSFFESIISKLPLGVLVHQDAKIVYANQFLLDLVGVPWEEVRGRSIFEFLSDESKSLVGKNMARRLAGEKVDDYEVEIETPSRGRKNAIIRAISIEYGGSPALLVALPDITERKRVEATLRLSEARFREMYLHTSAGVAVYEAVDDGRDFILRDLNPAGERISRISRDQAVGRRLLSIFPNIDKFGLLAALQRVFRTGQSEHLPAAYYEDGFRSGWRENDLYKLPSGEVVGIYEDITVRKQAEEREKALEAKLRRQEKTASIATLAGGVAHEINNPLAGILNFAQLIKDDADATAPAVQYAEEILRETNRAATIVRSLLAFSRPDSEGRSEAAPAEIIGGVAGVVETDLRGTVVRFETNVPPTIPNVICNAPQIQQVLLNLVVNAREALAERSSGRKDEGRIRLSAEGLVRDGRRFVRMTVEDNGPGISEVIRDRLFDPFFTTKSRALHTGLGLAISLRIVEEHGGHLSAESEPGKPTRLHLDLPASLSERPEGKETPVQKERGRP